MRVVVVGLSVVFSTLSFAQQAEVEVNQSKTIEVIQPTFTLDASECDRTARETTTETRKRFDNPPTPQDPIRYDECQVNVSVKGYEVLGALDHLPSRLDSYPIQHVVYEEKGCEVFFEPIHSGYRLEARDPDEVISDLAMEGFPRAYPVRTFNDCFQRAIEKLRKSKKPIRASIRVLAIKK